MNTPTNTLLKLIATSLFVCPCDFLAARHGSDKIEPVEYVHILVEVNKVNSLCIDLRLQRFRSVNGCWISLFPSLSPCIATQCMVS